MRRNRILAWLLAGIMLLNTTITGTAGNTVSGNEINLTAETVSAGDYSSVVVVNPLYQDVVEPKEYPNEISEEFQNAGTWTTAKRYNSANDVVNVIRQSMVDRIGNIEFTYETTIEPSSIMAAIQVLIDDAMKMTDTTTGVEGDYLRWHWSQYNLSAKVREMEEGTYSYDVRLRMEYYTTAAQEQELTQKVTNVLRQLQLDGKSEYEKSTAIYDYICRNVTYDFATLNDPSYGLKYSAYAAMVNGTAVCQGYASLYYRMCKESGLSVRLMPGLGQGEPHAWNIVEIGGWWYNLDSTWDAGYTEWDWYLQSELDFPQHIRDAEYSTTEFYEQYPMSPVSYGKNGASLGIGSQNPEYLLTTTAGERVSTLANGKIKLLAFVNSSESSQYVLTNMLVDTWVTHPNVEMLVISDETKENLANLEAAYGTSGAKWCYEGGTVLKGYTDKLGLRSTYPTLILIDKDNKIKWMAQDLFSIYPSNVVRQELQKLLKGTVADVQGLQIVYQTVAGVKLQWTSVKNADTYLIYRARKGSNDYVQIGETTGNAYIDTTIALDDSYQYKVRASQKGIYGGYSKVVATKTLKYAITSIELNKTSVTLDAGKTYKLSAKVEPAGVDKTAISWTSSNTKVATVDKNGKVTAVAKGTAKIYAKSTDGGSVQAACKVKVTQRVKKISFSETTVRLAKGKSKTLKAKITPTDASNTKLKWTTSSPKVVKVNANGKVTAQFYGKATITAQATDGSGVKKTCKVIVGYTIKYKMNGGTNHQDNPSVYYKEKVTLKTPSRKGYIFKGWYTDSDYTNRIKSIASTAKMNYTLYAKWEKIKVSQAKIKKVSNVKTQKINVSYGKVQGVTGYEIQYSTNKKFTKAATKTARTTKTTYVLGKLVKNTTYYVRVRAYKKDSAGNRIYGKFSSIKTVKVRR